MFLRIFSQEDRLFDEKSLLARVYTMHHRQFIHRVYIHFYPRCIHTDSHLSPSFQTMCSINISPSRPSPSYVARRARRIRPEGLTFAHISPLAPISPLGRREISIYRSELGIITSEIQ